MDTIKGKVYNVVDGDTFDIKDIRPGGNNQKIYADRERIRLSKFNAPELSTTSGLNAKIKLERLLLGKTVHCAVKARDTYRRLVCDVKVLETTVSPGW